MARRRHSSENEFAIGNQGPAAFQVEAQALRRLFAHLQFEMLARQHDLAQSRERDSLDGNRSARLPFQCFENQCELSHPRQNGSVWKMSLEISVAERNRDRHMGILVHVFLATIAAMTKLG